MGAAFEAERGIFILETLVSGTRILVLGAGGRLGAALVREWGGLAGGVEGLDRRGLDFSDLEAVRRKVSEREFDVAVNCAALTDVDRCEREPELGFLVNSTAVGVLASVCAAKGARLVHVSTDYVFDGEKREPYVEEDEARPVSQYGRSKLAGEEAALAASVQNLVVRVSWVFGPDRPSFVDGILRKARAGGEVSAVADKFAAPTYTLDAARGMRALIEGGASGLVHLCNRGGCSWRDYGQHALDCARAAGIELKQQEVLPIRMADLGAFVAKRPVYSVMDPGRFERLTGSRMRTWEEAVADYVRRMAQLEAGCP